MNKPQLSFITITYNGLKDTLELINSIHSTVHSVSYEIIVVDNASKENEAKLLKVIFPTIECIRSNTNLGFSGGNNLGIERATGEYLFFINNDTLIEEDHIAELISWLASDKSWGASSPKICFAQPPRLIQYAGFTPLSKITLRNEGIGFGKSDSEKYSIARPTPYLHGAAMLVKREVINKVGLMPEVYFLYYEEIDWCTQMTKAGYTLWYDPVCTIYHKESQSTGKESPLKSYYLTRNRLLYAYRNVGTIERVLSICYQITIGASKNIIRYLVKGRKDLAKATVKGVKGFFEQINQ